MARTTTSRQSAKRKTSARAKRITTKAASSTTHTSGRVRKAVKTARRSKPVAAPASPTTKGRVSSRKATSKKQAQKIRATSRSIGVARQVPSEATTPVALTAAQKLMQKGEQLLEQVRRTRSH